MNETFHVTANDDYHIGIEPFVDGRYRMAIYGKNATMYISVAPEILAALPDKIIQTMRRQKEILDKGSDNA